MPLVRLHPFSIIKSHTWLQFSMFNNYSKLKWSPNLSHNTQLTMWNFCFRWKDLRMRLWTGWHRGDFPTSVIEWRSSRATGTRAMRTMSGAAAESARISGVQQLRRIQPVQQSNPHPRYSFLSFHTKNTHSQASVSCIVFTTLICKRRSSRKVRRAKTLKRASCLILLSS